MPRSGVHGSNEIVAHCKIQTCHQFLRQDDTSGIADLLELHDALLPVRADLGLFSFRQTWGDLFVRYTECITSSGQGTFNKMLNLAIIGLFEARFAVATAPSTLFDQPHRLLHQCDISGLRPERAILQPDPDMPAAGYRMRDQRSYIDAQIRRSSRARRAPPPAKATDARRDSSATAETRTRIDRRT